MSYKRVLLKLSGEQLAGKYDSGIDPVFASWLSKEIQKARENGIEVVIMVGGGNFIRGAQIAGHGIQRVTADHMGMLATMINALALTDIFEANGLQTRCLSNIFAEQVAEKFIHRLANKHLDNGRVVIVAGGTGRPYLTHQKALEEEGIKVMDQAALGLALEHNMPIIIFDSLVEGNIASAISGQQVGTLIDSKTE